jgi:hypothetical protein
MLAPEIHKDIGKHQQKEAGAKNDDRWISFEVTPDQTENDRSVNYPGSGSFRHFLAHDSNSYEREI